MKIEELYKEFKYVLDMFLKLLFELMLEVSVVLDVSGANVEFTR